MNKTIIARVQQIRKPHSYWISQEAVILRNGEIGIDTDNHIFKIGNGADKWGDLPSYYFPIKEDGTTILNGGKTNNTDAENPITFVVCNESSSKYSQTYVPKKGEPVAVLTEYYQGMKIGDGTHTIQQLKYLAPDDDIISSSVGTVEDFISVSQGT